MVLPTLPTRPLVFRTPALLSVARRAGLPRTLVMLMLPFPLLSFPLGVFGRAPVGAAFSVSLSPVYFHTVDVIDVLVVVMLIARLSLSAFDVGDLDVVLRATCRRWYSSSVSPSNRVTSALYSDLLVNGSFSWFRSGDRMLVPLPYSLLVFLGWPGVGTGRLSSCTPMEPPMVLCPLDSISPSAARFWEPFGGVYVCPLLT